MNAFYRHADASPYAPSAGLSRNVHAEFEKVEAGFDWVEAAMAVAAITSGTIDGTSIGATTPSTGRFTTLQTTGNVGVGTPPATLWDATYKVINLAAAGTFVAANGNNRLEAGTNHYIDAVSARRYSGSSFGTLYQQISGQHAWFTAASGVAGALATFSERLRVDNGGTVLVNTSTSRDTKYAGTTNTGKLQIEELGFGGVSIIRNSNNNGANVLAFGKSRGTVAGSVTILNSGDDIGAVNFCGADGTNLAQAAAILVTVDAAPGAGSMPGRVSFLTTPAGSVTALERMRIDSGGYVGIGVTPIAGIRLYSSLTASNIAAGETGSYANVTATNASGAVDKTGSVGVVVASTGYGGTGSIIGALGEANVGSAVTVPNMFGVRGRISTSAAGSVAVAAAFQTSFSNSGGATFTDRIIGYQVSDHALIATNSVSAFYGAMSSRANTYNLYMVGTAANYLAGNTGIGGIASGAKLHVQEATNCLVKSEGLAGYGAFAAYSSSGNPAYSFYLIAGAEAARVAVTGATGVMSYHQGAGATERYRLDGGGNLLVTGIGGLGYGTGSGGAVGQAGGRTNGVTLDKTNGAITLVSAAGTAAWQSFTVTNNKVAATDQVDVCQKSGTDLYQIHVTAIAAGSFRITYATTGGVTVEQPVFTFAITKAVTA